MILQNDATAQEFEDLDAHRKMWGAFTGFMLKGVIATVVTLLVVGFVPGVL
jgi:hypothetical protein